MDSDIEVNAYGKPSSYYEIPPAYTDSIRYFVEVTERQLVAEDISWTEYLIPDLSELCNKVIIENFNKFTGSLNSLEEDDRRYIIKNLNRISLHIAVPLIDDEDYWKRQCIDRWPMARVSMHGNSYKRMYLEQNLTYALEFFKPDISTTQEIEELLPLCSEYVEKLNITQLQKKDENYDDQSAAPGSSDDFVEPTRLNFVDIFSKLPKLKDVSMFFGKNNVGLSFEWSVVHTRYEDVLNVCQALECVPQLECLRIHCSLLNCEWTTEICKQLVNHHGLVTLDLSNNMIGNDGGKALAFVMQSPQSRIKTIKVTNNLIGCTGATAIAFALQTNKCLTKLDMGLNRIGNRGLKNLGKALLKNNTLTELNVNTNQFADEGVEGLLSALEHNKSITVLDLSCNTISEGLGKKLQNVIRLNKYLLTLDLRLTGSGMEIEPAVTSQLKYNLKQTGKQFYYCL